jgi:uncharacterized repeat protein (TIGR03803 family)
MNRSAPRNFALDARTFFVLIVSVASVLAAADSSSAQSVETIYSFDNPGGVLPTYVFLTQGRDGWLYGTTSNGGGYGAGTIFKQQVAGNANVVLYTFHGTSDGGGPWGGLTLARDGNFYGSTTAGGTFSRGVLFRITSAGVLTVLYSFSGGVDGSYPQAPPIEGIDGNLYGTTNGLSSQSSTVYEFSRAGIFSTLYTFNATDGDDTQAPLLQATDGTLYATAHTGGAFGGGSIIELTTSGKVKRTHSFDITEGSSPDAPLIQGVDGSIYGTTQGGGANFKGAIFKLDSKWNLTTLYNFGTISLDGSDPFGGLTQGTDKNFYGTTSSGGTTGATIFELTSTSAYSQLYNFPLVLGSQSQNPLTAPTQHTNGKFYGVTRQGGTFGYGSVYRLDMGLAPFVTFVLPISRVGKPAQILGQRLTGTTSVTFNGVPATSFKIVSDTYMTAVVPSGASTGPVVVSTPGGPLTSNVKFRVLQ